MEQAPPARDRVLRVLADARPELHASFGVTSLALFGSVARGRAGPGSDADVLVEFAHPIGLVRFGQLESRLEELVGHRVDLVEPQALHPALRDRILSGARRAAWGTAISRPGHPGCHRAGPRVGGGVGPETFAWNKLVVDAVRYRISVIGEAASAIPAEVRERHPEIP